MGAPPPAHAQYIGGTAPVGTTTLNFTVPGVAHAVGLETFFTCTNPTSSTINVAVEVFDDNGAPMNASSALVVPMGGTVQFATGNAAPFVQDQSLSPVSTFTKGAAKIWSSSKSLHCSVVLVDTNSNRMANLSLVAAGKKQKGD